MAVSVMKDGKAIWQHGYGFADLEKQLPPDPETTLYRIASVSKPLSATALARMTVDSVIDLEASLYKYVPYFPEKPYDITLNHLGTHTSGIRAYRGKELGNTIPMTIKEGMSLFKDDPLRFRPGTAYLYSSFNWNLLALAMQEAAGMPFEAYMKEKVLTPLNLHHTVPDRQENLPGKAVFYTRSQKKGFRPAFPVHNYYKLASGGYLSTAADVAKVGDAWLQGKSIPSDVASGFITAHRIKDASTGYGIGWETGFDHRNRPFYGHTGNGMGGYAFFRVYPAQRTVFSILVNATHPAIDAELQQITNAFLSAASSNRN